MYTKQLCFKTSVSKAVKLTLQFNYSKAQKVSGAVKRNEKIPEGNFFSVQEP